MTLIKDSEGLLHEITTARGLSSGLPVRVEVRCGKNFAPQFGPRNVFETEDGHQVTCVRCVAISCDHGITFDKDAAANLDSYEVKKWWPRLSGPCPLGCGYNGIFYASYEHYISGDW